MGPVTFSRWEMWQLQWSIPAPRPAYTQCGRGHHWQTTYEGMPRDLCRLQLFGQVTHLHGGDVLETTVCILRPRDLCRLAVKKPVMLMNGGTVRQCIGFNPRQARPQQENKSMEQHKVTVGRTFCTMNGVLLVCMMLLMQGLLHARWCLVST
jgi:hypothetical protein